MSNATQATQTKRKRYGRPKATRPTEFQQQIIRYALEFPEANLHEMSAELQSHPAQIRYHLNAVERNGWLPWQVVLEIEKRSFRKNPTPIRRPQPKKPDMAMKQQIAEQISWLLKHDAGARMRLALLIKAAKGLA